MEIKEAIELLKYHNQWRRYDGEIDKSPKMTDPKKLGIAIDIVVNKFENLFISGVGNSYGVNENDINDYGEYMFTDVGLGNFPEIDFKEWFKSEELQKRRKNYH